MFGHELQDLPPADISATLEKAGKKCFHQIVSSIFFYAWAVDNMSLKALNTNAQHTASATKLTLQ